LILVEADHSCQELTKKEFAKRLVKMLAEEWLLFPLLNASRCWPPPNDVWSIPSRHLRPMAKLETT